MITSSTVEDRFRLFLSPVTTFIEIMSFSPTLIISTYSRNLIIVQMKYLSWYQYTIHSWATSRVQNTTKTNEHCLTSLKEMNCLKTILVKDEFQFVVITDFATLPPHLTSPCSWHGCTLTLPPIGSSVSIQAKSFANIASSCYRPKRIHVRNILTDWAYAVITLQNV